MDLPPEGARISVSGHTGTVRFVGQVSNTAGIWLGVEWDDPQRGRHDGSKDGIQYFTCRAPNAGSFIRPSANISYGRSFLEALSFKYIETPHGSASQEKVVLGSSHGAIVVEAVRLDKIRGKLANLERLREVSLDNENVARCDAPGAIQETCPNIRGLDLSSSLLPSWDIVASITKELPNLERLALNRNLLQIILNPNVMETAFLRLTELQLNGTHMAWCDMQAATAFMPNLRLVEMGYNRLTHLITRDNESPSSNSTIQAINLDSNVCSDWVHIRRSLNPYTSLQRLIVTSNCIDTIPLPENPQEGLQSLKHISLSYNKIDSWSDVDALSSWCPGLETLTISGNPLTDRDQAGHSRPFTISKIPSLLALDGAAISTKERADSEIFYQSYIIQHGPQSEEERIQAHPQWLNLCAKHGTPQNRAKGKPAADKLSKHLIALNMYQSSSPTADDSLQSRKLLVLQVLPTMTLRTLRMKIRKMLKHPNADILVWVGQTDGGLVELGIDRDQQDLDWLGITEGSDLVFHVVNK